VARLATAYLADGCLLDVLDGPHTLRRTAAHADPDRQALVESLHGCFPFDPGAARGPAAVLRTCRPAVHAEAGDDVLDALAAGPAQGDALRRLGCRSAVLVPLVARDQALGVLTLVTTEPGRHAGPPALPLAEELARRAALALDNARLYDETQDALRRRDEFLAMLGHELRNPLAPILYAVELLRLQADARPEQRALHDVIERQGRHLVRLVDDLLDLSRVTRGKIELRLQPTDLAAVVADAVEASRPLMSARRHELTVHLPGGPLPLVADPTRLAQVLINLLNNAAKYTDPGGHVRLTVARTAGSPCAPAAPGGAGGEVEVKVSDDGVGLEPDLLPRVFEPFTQAGRSLDRSQGGLGIGLALVRRLVEMHGGRVTAFSEGPGRGSEFVVTLPLRAVDVAPPAPPEPGPAGPRRVLLIEDHADVRDMLCQLLRLDGHRVDVAPDGPCGLEAARSLRPDVILVDIGLPGMDGYEVARRLRADLPRVRLLALTGYDQPEYRRRARDAGFDALLVKPVDVAELERWLTSPA
jgi:signal transduction histidine kinase